METFPSLEPLLIVLAGYLALQLLLNLVIGIYLRSGGRLPVKALKGTFWAGLANAVYFTVCAALLQIMQLTHKVEPRLGYGLLALIGLPLGPLLWYLVTMGRKLGQAWFGKSELVPAEDAILRVPPDSRYIGWGVMNLAVAQPVGRELFLRAAFLPTVAAVFGWPAAVGATALFELATKLNVVWVFQTLAYSLALSLLFIATGSALSGLVAAAVAGLIQATVLFKISGGSLRME